MKTTTSLVIALGLAATPVAFAKKNPDAPKKEKPDISKVFNKKDKDGDGFISKEEFTKGAKNEEKAAKAFAKKDKNGDGKISLEEFTPKPKADGAGKKKGGKKKKEG